MRTAGAYLALVCVCGMASAEPIVIDFQELEFAGEGWGVVPGDYSSQGFTFSNGRFFYFGTSDPWYPGSTCIWNDRVDTQAVLKADSGMPFTLLSIDLTPLLGSGLASTTLHLQGYRGDDLVADQLLATSGIGRVLEHFALDTSFSDLDRVVFVDDYPYTEFDNVTILPAPGVLTAIAAVVPRRRRR